MIDYTKELEIAKRVQQGLLAVQDPQIEEIGIAKRCIPAATLGGDFYTFSSNEFKTLAQNAKIPGVIEYAENKEHNLGIIIGDVAGHGVSSALVMALASGILNELSKTLKSPGEVFKIANNRLLSYIKNSSISHVTACCGFINLEKNTFKYAKAGHPPIILVRKDRKLEYLNANGLFLGMFENEEYEEKEIQLNPGDRLIFYTDGITEAVNKDHEMFGQKRFEELILAHNNSEIATLLEKTYDAVYKFTNTENPKDDQTMVIVEFKNSKL